MKPRTLALAAVAAALHAAPGAAQEDIETVCDGVPSQLRQRCIAVAQAVDAAQPQLGIALAGGNPTLGTASTGGVRLGMIPRVSLTGRVNVALARLPDIRREDTGAGTGTARLRFPAPAVGANASVGLTQGMGLAPMLGGFGAIDLLAGVSVLPLGLLGGDFGDNAFSWGGGVRVGVLRESFVTPGVSVSVMFRDLGEVSFGNVCEGTETSLDGDRSLCLSEGDAGEIAFGLSNWSTRAAVSKRLLGLGLTAGIGHDRFSTDADFAFRTPGIAGDEIRRFRDVRVRNSRWSTFVNLSYTVLVGSLAAEAGWMQGATPIEGFPAASDFDPREGTFFGSLGARLSL
jgi:hypothetical protein